MQQQIIKAGDQVLNLALRVRREMGQRAASTFTSPAVASPHLTTQWRKQSGERFPATAIDVMTGEVAANAD